MEKKVSFSVSVIGCNADTFLENYGEYIKAFRNDGFGNKVFFLNAPQSVKDEIAGLK